LQERSTAKQFPNSLAGSREGKELAGQPPRKPFLFLVGAITLPVIVLDQLSKLYVQAHMALYESIALIPNYLDLTYTLNPGAAFSMLADAPLWVRKAILLSMAAAAIVVLLVLIARSERVSLNSIALALILGGASGNLIDRVVRWRVIDFVRAHYYDLNYPVFNVADSAISVGVALFILVSLFGSDPDAKPDRSD
jgi:signal peptidase II